MIDEDKFEITLILLYKKGVYLEYIPKHIKILYIFPDIKNKFIIKFIEKIFIKYFPKLFYRLFINNHYDVEIAFLEGVCTKVVANSSNNGIKIAWVHTDMCKFKWSNQFYRKGEEVECYSKFDKIVCVSDNANDSFLKRFKEIDCNKTSIIYNPIIPNEIEEKANKENIKYDDFTILSLGRLVEVKGFERLIRVHSRIIKRKKHNLVIVGDGPEREKLENLINELKVNDTVSLVGFKKNPYPYIKACDLYVCSSFAEGYPISMLEALVLEKPIISTNITGPRDILENGKYGLIVNNTEDGIFDGLMKILNDEIYYSKLKNVVVKRKAKLLADNSIKEIEDLINER